MTIIIFKNKLKYDESRKWARHTHSIIIFDAATYVQAGLHTSLSKGKLNYESINLGDQKKKSR